jgi:UDP-N-acetylmuramoylalanine--D-glutamate ligase
MNLYEPGALDFTGKRVTVVGLGIEGVDLVRFLSRRGAVVTVSDSKPPEALADRIRQVSDLPVSLSLGANSELDIADADAVFVSQGVPLELPALKRAKEKGIPISSMVGLFLELCPGPIAGITGSSGKTTTTALVGDMFRVDERPVFVGGNIGVGLLQRLDDIRTYTWSVLEMSHTQLQLVERSPHVAAVLNITPNHLDRFSWDDYRRLKSNIIRFQRPGDIAVLNRDDPECRSLEPLAKGEVLWFSMSEDVPGDGVFVRDRWAVARRGGMEKKIFHLDSLPLRGEHNRANAVAAAAIATACGVTPDAITFAAGAFRGVPHRLELVDEVGSVQYYNDSIATTPERTVAGLRSFHQPVVLLLGGRDKKLPLDDLVREAASRCRAVVLFGEAAGKLEEAFRSAAPQLERRRVDGLEEAVRIAAHTARPGDAVLLSPACTSYDAYENFERRGEHFRALVRQLTREVQPSHR